MADSKSKHHLLTAAQSARNLTTVIQLVAEQPEEVLTAGVPLNVKTVRYVRVTNNSGSTATPSGVIEDVSTPLFDETGTVVAVPTASSQLVDVRGVAFVTFDEDVTAVRVN